MNDPDRGPAGGSRLRAQLRRLSPPTQPIPAVERVGLRRSLDVASAGRLTILIGPTGYGKTTLLAQWVQSLSSASQAVAWYTASDIDREPDAFLQMLALSLDRAGVDMGDMALRKTGNASPKAMVDAIILRLERFERPLVLIIDDFERIDHPAITHIIDTIVDALPDTIHLVLATRRKPQLTLSALRARGAVRIIESDELRFEQDEVAEVLHLVPETLELARVVEQTEGWPVAVQLYRLWRAQGRHADAPGFGGQVQEVADYFAEQVLADLSDDRRELVFDIAAFEYAEPALVDRIRNRTDSNDELADIAAHFPALVQRSMADGEPAYHLHPLLAEYAQARRARGSAHFVQVQAEAARWFAEQERYVAAVRHAVLSGQRDVQRSIVAALPVLDIFLAYGAGDIRAILRELPAGLIETVPRVRLMTALAHFKTGAFGSATAMLELVREEAPTLSDSHDGARFRIEYEALALVFSIYTDGAVAVADAEARIARILKCATSYPLIWAWCENAMIVVYQLRGDLAAARHSIVRAREIYETMGLLGFAEAHLRAHELLILLAAGQLRQAAELANMLLRNHQAGFDTEPVAVAMAQIALALIDFERNYRERAGDMIRLALEQFGEGEAWFDQYAITYPVIADVTARRHGPEAAVRFLEEADRKLRARGMDCCSGYLHALVSLYRLRGTDASTARAIAEDPALHHSCVRGKVDVAWRERDMANRALATAALQAGDPETARRHARAMIDEGRERDRAGMLIKGLILFARACADADDDDDDDDDEEADRAIAEAVRLACTEGVTAAFVEEGPAIVPLLQRASAQAPTAIDGKHAEAILRTLIAHPQFRSPDMLTDREAEIVSHLADGASNKLIARRLGITDNTVKFHLKKVFTKYGVSSRKEAVARFMRDE